MVYVISSFFAVMHGSGDLHAVLTYDERSCCIIWTGSHDYGQAHTIVNTTAYRNIRNAVIRSHVWRQFICFYSIIPLYNTPTSCNNCFFLMLD
jgi:hypothetical protein